MYMYTKLPHRRSVLQMWVALYKVLYIHVHVHSQALVIVTTTCTCTTCTCILRVKYELKNRITNIIIINKLVLHVFHQYLDKLL